MPGWMKEFVKKIRKYEIRIRKAVTSQMQGDFHSIFKGSGLEFDDVRTYQWGDDVRTIDWKVTAKGHGTFVKTFIETKEQTVFFILDVSGSQEIGTPGNQKMDISKELCGVLSLVALKESSKVGVICFSDQKELYVKPAKGNKQLYQIVSALQELKPGSLKTDLNKSIVYTQNAVKKRSVVFMISDFIDEGYHKNLKALAKKHDLVVIQIKDNRETNVPNLGIIPVFDKENRKTVWVNTASSYFKNQLDQTYAQNTDELLEICRKYQINHLEINTNEDYVPKLIRLFKVRNKSLKRV
jgi:uncharacterized protein (DUF58 family)